MRLHLADVELEAARLALARGERAAAEQAWFAARDAVLDLGYHRCDPEIEALATALDQTPPDWLHRADIEVTIPMDSL